MKKCFVFRIFSLLLALIVLIFVPITVTAESHSMSTKSIQNHSLVDEESITSSKSESYSYTAPDVGSFVIENVNGEISVANNILTVLFAGQTMTVPSFDYYKVLDNNGNLRFYQADVLKDPSQTGNFVYISIYVENDALYSMYIQHLSNAEGKLYNMLIELSSQQFLYFDQIATTFVMGTDEVSQRLKTSARAYSYGTFEDSNLLNSTTIGNDVAVPMSLNPIADHSYDEYTDSDGIIRTYVDNYFWEYTTGDGYTIIDDPIVNIVPKELCFIPGEHIYVGKEYGFFMRVTTDSLNAAAYATDIMVFDIIHTTPSFPTETTGGARIEPLFQFKYRAVDADDFGEGVYTVASHLSCVVIPHPHYDAAEYFLKDIGFKFTLDNANALNPGDDGYDPYEDDGAFIIQTRANAQGVGLKKKGGYFLADTASFGFGFIPFVGTALSVCSYVHDVYNGFGNGEYCYSREAEIFDNEANVDTYETNNTDQIDEHGNLIKSQSVAIISNENSPRIINVGGYAEAKYVIARKSGSTNNRIRVTTSVSVNVVADETYRIFDIKWLERGDIIDYGRATGTYETGNYSRLVDQSVNGSVLITIPASEQRQIIKFIPAVSGLYKMFTISSNGDPDFHITNATNGADIIPATDDIGREEDLNAALTLSLIAGNTYYINAYSYNSAYGYTLSIGYSPVINQPLTINSRYAVITEDDSFVMLKFTVTTSGYYSISTNRTYGDPQIFLFASSGVLLDSNDDFDDYLDSFLVAYLVAGTTYYLAVQGYKGSAATFDVLVAS